MGFLEVQVIGNVSGEWPQSALVSVDVCTAEGCKCTRPSTSTLSSFRASYLPSLVNVIFPPVLAFDMNQNLCIICCYAFPDKRNRFIRDEARESFYKFSEVLGFPLPSCSSPSGGGTTLGGGLNLPFGECLTVCGDCLSLVDLYVQRRSVQLEKEERLLQLQKAVSKALNELTGVVKDVQGHIDQLQETVRMGDGSTLEQFVEAKSFRDNILSLDTGASQRPTEFAEQIKLESQNEDTFNVGYDYNDQWEETDPEAGMTGAQNNYFAELPSTSSGATFAERSHRASATKRKYAEDWLQTSESEDDEDEDDEIKPQRKQRGKFESINSSWSSSKKVRKLGHNLSPEEAAKWRENLMRRIADQPRDPEETQETETVFQIVNDNLQFRGVLVGINDTRRMLECLKCQKMFFEERDVTSEDLSVELLMKTHILDKHGPIKKKEPRPLPESLEIIEYTCTTKDKIRYKIADKNHYAYVNSMTRKDNGATYYRCDHRASKCSAMILHHNGRYSKLRKGWTPDGFHVTHQPDVERVNAAIVLGKAKEMYLTDPSKSIDDVCDIILNESGAVSLERLKKRLRNAKPTNNQLPPEDKPPQQCYQCGKFYKNARTLARHLKEVHAKSTSSELTMGAVETNRLRFA